jgi:4-hydroxy-3-methylbut-2-enyl diphosphate reductase
MDVLLAQPRGFCAGVARAIEIVERALARYGAPVYVYHEIVHNGHVVDDLASRGAVFVDEIESIPWGAVTVFSAHGVSHAVVAAAQARGLRVVDATCPLVTKVHVQAQRYSKRGYTVVVVGHAGHEEVVGTTGSVDGPVHVVGTLDDVAALPMPRDAAIAYVTQTTLSLDDTRELIDALEARYPAIVGPGLDDICYATLNRQRSTRAMARQVDLVLVVGARNSSNSNRLREVALQQGVPAYLVQTAADLDPAWLAGAGRVGVTAGASAPEVLVQDVCTRLVELGAGSVRELPGLAETVKFRLPEALQQSA